MASCRSHRAAPLRPIVDKLWTAVPAHANLPSTTACGCMARQDHASNGIPAGPRKEDQGFGAAMLELSDVSKSFGALQALNSVSVRVGTGQIVGLIGPNGSGKSTLFDIITG